MTRINRPKISKNITETIGNTPLVELNNISKGLPGNIVAKLESFNPLSSVKDRIAFAMINAAQESGKLKAGGTIIEATSGNTGIGLAFMSAQRGYKLILTMPDTMSMERRKLLEVFGAHLELTPGAEGMNGAIKKAEELKASIPGSIILSQFTNPANPHIHYRTTGVEVWEDSNGMVDYFVSGVGTGGTLSGTGKYLKEMNPDIKVIAVEPAESAVISGKNAGPHKIQGIGAGFIPDNLDTSLIDETIKISSEKSGIFTRLLAKKEGILAGISSGAALAAAVELAEREENKGKMIVALLPDTGERYLSTWVFEK